PPPLINASNLITTLYAFSGAAAAIYGTSKYLIDPMLESLTAARHSLHETAQSNLDTLNERLEKHVSAVPEGGAKQLIGDDNASETTEDMGPLFHRTIGTQTSLPASPSSASSSTDAPEPPLDIITTHESSLKALTASLSSLIPPRTDPQSAPEEKLRSQVYELRHYLNALAHKDVQHVEAKDDAVNKFKAEIRGVKGVLLSARNFPSGTGRVAG
ncbi:MAG: hypothetical protein L6R39_006815, partial [Caloplaca ligustica]